MRISTENAVLLVYVRKTSVAQRGGGPARLRRGYGWSAGRTACAVRLASTARSRRRAMRPF